MDKYQDQLAFGNSLAKHSSRRKKKQPKKRPKEDVGRKEGAIEKKKCLAKALLRDDLNRRVIDTFVKAYGRT